MEMESEEEKEMKDASQELCGVFILFFIIILAYLYETKPLFKKISVFLPLPSANLLLGIICGGILSLLGGLQRVFQFDPEFFFTFLLPPCILAAGITIQKDPFFYNFGTIIILAFVGTTISSFFIGGFMCLLGSAGLVSPLDFTDAMILGSLISAVDPIATIVVLEHLGVEPDLYILIFGEAVLNDAAAITINRVFVKIKSTHSGLASLAPAMGLILLNGICSSLIGITVGLLGAYIFKRTDLRRLPHLELGFFFLLALIPYLVCEIFELSGIMAILFAGIIGDYYTRCHLSETTKQGVNTLTRMLAVIIESWIFVYLGMAVFLESGQKYEGSFIFCTLILCFLGRAVSILPLTWLINLCRGKNKISCKYQAVMWFSGLRGPVAFALAHAAPNEKTMIQTTTLIIIFITTFLIGGITLPVLKALDLEAEKDKKFNRRANWFHRLDGICLRPLFGVPRRVGWKDQTWAMQAKEHEEDYKKNKTDSVESISLISENSDVETEEQPTEPLRGPALGYDMGEIELGSIQPMPETKTRVLESKDRSNPYEEISPKNTSFVELVDNKEEVLDSERRVSLISNKQNEI